MLDTGSLRRELLLRSVRRMCQGLARRYPYPNSCHPLDGRFSVQKEFKSLWNLEHRYQNLIGTLQED